MNPRLLFWVPAVLRLALVLVGFGLVWYFFGLMSAMAAGLIAMTALVLLQLIYLERLGSWLEDPQGTRLPDGSDAWTDIFAKLYRMRRDNEKHQAELSEWLARFRQAMSLLPDGVVIMDDVLFLEWSNSAAEEHLGLSLERDKGMRVTNLIRSPEFIDYIVLGRYDKPLEMSFRNRNLVAHIIPFENRRQILVTHDATESQRIEMMRRDFVANASHELRTPLTVINGFLEIALSQPKLDAQTRKSHLELMLGQGQRMQNLVEDMLTLTRLESVDHPLRTERIDMAELLEQILQEGRALSGGKHTISLECTGPDLTGNIDELHSAFGNLVSNAVRYTPEGGEIALSWQSTVVGARFSVKDNGIGINPQHIARLTERFYRVDKSRSRQTHGTGLGLAIVKHVLLRHKATLEISSVPDKGSVFTVHFPAGAAVPASASRPAVEKPAA